MKSGYKVKWTDNAIAELRVTFEYLEENWSEKEMEAFRLRLTELLI